MAESRRGVGNTEEAERFRRACVRIETVAGVGAGLAGRLRRLGDVVADYRLASKPGTDIDESGALTGLDDDELVEWWSHGCALRSVVFTAAASGDLASVDWMLLMARFAERGTAHEFARLLRDELPSVIALVLDARVDPVDQEALVVAFDADDRVGWRDMPLRARARAFGRWPA